jgi:hypothetical protein
LKRWERLLILLIAAHSYAVGLALLFATEWGVRFGGWGGATTLFFPRQAGAFHLVLATGYLIEHARHRGVALLLTAKGTAVVFLAAMTALDGGPWVVPLSGLGDGLMALAVWAVHRRAAREELP